MLHQVTTKFRRQLHIVSHVASLTISHMISHLTSLKIFNNPSQNLVSIGDSQPVQKATLHMNVLGNLLLLHRIM